MIDATEPTIIVAIVGVMGATITAGFKFMGDAMAGQCESRIREHETNCSTAENLMEMMGTIKADIKDIQADLKAHVNLHIDELRKHLDYKER